MAAGHSGVISNCETGKEHCLSYHLSDFPLIGNRAFFSLFFFSLFSLTEFGLFTVVSVMLYVQESVSGHRFVRTKKKKGSQPWDRRKQGGSRPFQILLPTWESRGVCVYWKIYSFHGFASTFHASAACRLFTRSHYVALGGLEHGLWGRFYLRLIYLHVREGQKKKWRHNFSSTVSYHLVCSSRCPMLVRHFKPFVFFFS